MTARRTDTKDPRGSRERALKILFQADVRGVSPDVTLDRLTDDQAARAILDEVEELSEDGELLPPKPGVGDQQAGGAAAAPLDGFTSSLVLGVHEHRAAIDELISRFARKWQIHRMPVVDRTVLRLATFELLQGQTSAAIVINEAVGLAKALSTDDSGRYVNGVLESIRKHLASAEAAPEPAAPSEQAPSDEDPANTGPG